MFVYKSRFLKRGEVWFDQEPDATQVDWIYHRQRSSPLANSRWKYFYTVLNDLRKPPGELLADMDEKTARRIIEAEDRDGLWCERCDSESPELMDEVEAMWNQFAVAQQTPLLERRWLDQISKAGALDVVAAKDPAGNVMAYHLVYLTPKRARQIIAISPYRAVPTVAWRNAVSRANCLVHWHNFLTYREQGIREFDFGGWYPGTKDIRQLGLNRFKKSFGGRIVREYDCEQPVTVKGWTLLKLAYVLARLKQARPFIRAESYTRNNAEQIEEHKVSPAFR